MEIFHSGKFDEFEETVTGTVEDVWLKLQGDSFGKSIETGNDIPGIIMNDTNFVKISRFSGKFNVTICRNFDRWEEMKEFLTH